MGQAGEKQSEDDSPLKKLTDSERNCLEKIFPTDPEQLGTSSVDKSFSQLENHLAKYFSSSLASTQFTTFCVRCRSATVENSALIRNKILSEIANLTHGEDENVIQFALESLRDNSSAISLDMFKTFVFEMVNLFSLHKTVQIFGTALESCKRFVSAFVSEPGTTSHDDLQKQLLQYPLVSELIRAGYKYIFYEISPIFSKDSLGYMPVLIPDLETSSKMKLHSNNSILSLSEVIYLNNSFPINKQHKWRFLYSSNLQGESFSRFSTSILNQGPLLIIIKDQDGYIFGGYISTNVELSSRFQGDENCFLFQLLPSFGVFNPTGYNKNFVYMNVGQETMPNGWGMGGRHNYFGLWLSTEFGKGHSKAKPTSTTYGSPRLSRNDEFSVDVVEAWGVGNEPKDDEDDDDEATSVIDKNPDAVAFLRITGKELASDGYRESERTSTQPEITHLHDPMHPQ